MFAAALPWIISALLGSLVVGAVAEIALRIHERIGAIHRPSERHAVHQVALVAVFACVVTASVSMAMATSPRLLSEGDTAASSVVAPLLLALPAPFDITLPDERNGVGVARIIVWCWLFGLVACAVGLVTAHRRARRWAAAATPVSADTLLSPAFATLVARCRLATSGHMEQPVTVGCFNPVILVPDDFASSLAPHERDAVLAHEIAHIRRRDPLKELVLRLILLMFWFNPFVRRLYARYAETREAACDALAVRLGAERKALASALARLALTATRGPVLSATGEGGRSGVGERVRQLLRPAPDAARLPSFIVASALAAMLGLVTTAGLSRIAVAYYDTHARYAYLEGPTDVDLDHLTYDVCALLSANGSHWPASDGDAAGAVTVRFDADVALINGRVAPADLQPLLNDVFARHQVRRGAGVYLRYRQADSVLAVSGAGSTVGQTLGPGYWLNFDGVRD